MGQVLHIFAYLQYYANLCIKFDSRRLSVDDNIFKAVDWSGFYPDADPLIPDTCPEGLVEAVKITCYVDAKHTGNMVTRRSHTGFVILVNNASIIWWSKW